MKKIANDQDGNTWRMTIDRITEMSTGNYAELPTGIIDGAELELTFNSDGKLVTIEQNPIEELDKVLLEGLSGIEFNYNKAGEELQDTYGPSGTFKDILLFDSQDEETYKNLHQYANDMDAQPYAIDGNSSGKLEGYTIDASGMVVGIFDNGERKNLAQIMLAKFDNPAGYKK